MLIWKLTVTPADLMPVVGVAITLPSESVPYRISERLYEELKAEATAQAVSVSALLKTLRDEIHNTD